MAEPAEREYSRATVPKDLLEQLELAFTAQLVGARQAAAEKLGQLFRQHLEPKQLQILLDACQDSGASKRRRFTQADPGGAARSTVEAVAPAGRGQSVQELSVLLPHCLSPNAFEALVPHLQLTPREWAQVWPAFPKGEGETSALVVLLEAASRNRGLVDAVVHLVVSGRTKVASFREAVAQVVPQEMGATGRWIEEELPSRSRSYRDVLCQCFVTLFPSQDKDLGPRDRQTWSFDTWWSELTGSLQGAAPGAALALVAQTLLELQRKGPLTLELVLRPKRRRNLWTWLTQQRQMLPEASDSVTAFMTRLGHHSMQVEAPVPVVHPAAPAPEPVVDLEADEPQVVESIEAQKVREVDDEDREAAWYNTVAG